jgi:hypothetical protein
MVLCKVNKESAMSEPVSNAEIEDVLSSIRRLVSENAGAARRGDPEAMPEKLVLTPAFRVDEGEDQPEAPRAHDGEVVTFDGAGRTEGGPEAVEEAVAAVVEDDALEAVVAAPEMDEATVAPNAPEQADDSQKSALERRIAELEAVIARSASDFEPDGSEEELAPERAMFRDGHDAGDAEAVSQVTDEADAPHAEAEAEVAPDAPRAEETADDEGQATDAQPADSWQMAEPMAKPVENEGVAAFRTIEEAFEIPDAPHADADADAEAAVADAWEDVEAGDATDDDDEEAGAVLDEDALREMVARMVREELQGSVGERITHNVRRMVRREIARALALKDFE